MLLRERVCLAVGFALGFLIFKFTIHNQCQFISLKKEAHMIFPQLAMKNLYNESLADLLFKKVRILCLIMTHPRNHRKKAMFVKNSWGERCNKILFMSSAQDELLKTIVLNLNDTRHFLWRKTKESLKYAYENHFDEFDWILKADDDSYVVMENLRYMLYQYDSNMSLYFGHRFTKKTLPNGYMAGGGYILSKQALHLLVTELIPNRRSCRSTNDIGDEDYNIGLCLKHKSLFVDCRDDKKQKRFFPSGVETQLWQKNEADYWYFNDMYYDAVQGNLNCCSDTLIQTHYIKPKDMIFLEYLIYNVHPFGLEKNLTEILPEKLHYEEILTSSNDKSSNRNRYELLKNLEIKKRKEELRVNKISKEG